MPDRLRKLLGSVALVIFVCVYALMAMTVAAAKLPGTSGLTQLAYFVVAGLAWVLPAGALIAWMVKPRGKGT
jgi:peptidoglycan/LPS O-acetylase OafA/YrhL